MLPENEEEAEDPLTLKPQLYSSARENDLEAVLKYLAAGVPSTYIDETGWTALHWAAKSGNAQMVRALLDHQASVPYHFTVSTSLGVNKKEAKELSEAEVKLAAMNADTLKETFESMQKRREFEDVTDVSKDLLRNTPLLWAAFKGHLFIVWMLLCDGYNPNDVDDMGNNALHLAAAAGHIKVAQVLIQDGVFCNAVNIYKNLPFDTTTDQQIREILVTAMQKGASMTQREATQKHDANTKWYRGIVKRLSDVLAALELTHQVNADVDDELTHARESARLLRDLHEALQDARDWAVSDDLVQRGTRWVAELEATQELQRVTDSVRELVPIRSQRVFVANSQRLEQSISRAEALQVDPRVVSAAKSLIATCKIELWLFMMQDRLSGIEIAADANEHDVGKLGAAVAKARLLGASEGLVAAAALLHLRLVTELEGARALHSVPVVRLPMDSPPEGYWQDSDRGSVQETPGFPLPPEGGEYVWQPSQSFSLLQRAVERIRSILGSADGAGVNQWLVGQLRERLGRAEKELKLLEAKDAQDKVLGIEAAVKLAKKKKKGAAPKKK